MHRPLIKLTTAVLLAAPLLSACSVDDAVRFLGPRADAEVLSLAQRADADAAALADTDPATAELRTRHADQLYAEIDRLCGVRDDGRVPDSCAVERTLPEGGEIGEAGVLGESYAVQLEELSDVPTESVALVTGQAIDLATLADPVTLPTPFTLTNREDVAAARDLLAWEHATAYGLGIAAAFISPDQSEALAALADAHDERILGLRTLLESAGEAPVAAPGYELTASPVPTDSASAAEFVTSLEADAVQLWHTAATDARTAEWREWAVAGAAHAQDAAGEHNFAG